MTNITSEQQACIDALVSRADHSWRVSDTVQLSGDASLRHYFRVFLQPPAPASVIATLMPSGDGGHEIGARCPPQRFGEVCDLFRSNGIPAPEIYAYSSSPAVPAYLQQDLGDQTLAAEVAQHPDRLFELYQKAIGYLPAIASLTPSFPVPVADHTLLLAEFIHFHDEIMVAARSPDSGAAVERWERLTDLLVSGPTAVAHRDYHARNIMVQTDGSLSIIDFQDLFIAPAGYDLTSLTRDAYIDFTERDRICLESRDQTKWEAPLPSQFVQREQWLDLVGLQRNLKAAGRFAWFQRVRGNSSYMPAVPRLLRIACLALERLPLPEAEWLAQWIRRNSPVPLAAEGVDLIPFNSTE